MARPSQPSASTTRSRSGLIVLLAALIFALTFLYRFAAMGGHFAGFEDDQFVHLSQAQQMLLGEHPTRDFVELGMPMTVALSAVAQVVGGRTLFSEAVLTMGMLGLSSALLFVLAARASGSITIAFLIALVQIAMAPRFYNYPKLLAYAIAIPALWAYIDRPARARAAVVGVAGAAAFLLRHDHGAYVAMAALAAVIVAQWPDPKRMTRDGSAALIASLVCAGPYLLITQVDGGVIRHFREFLSFATRASAQTDLKAVTFDIDPSQPLWTHVPEPEAPRRIHVEWRAGLSPEELSAAEEEHGLTEREPFSDKVWVYRLTDTGSARLELIVKDPRIVDTDGLDRERFTFNEPAPGASTPQGMLQRARAVTPLPGILREANAAPFLYYLFTGIPLIALLLTLLRWRVGAPAEPSRATIVVLALLTIVVNAALLRGNLPSRLADVTELVGVLGAWVAAVLIIKTSPRFRPVTVAAAALVVVATGLSVQALEGVTGQLSQAGVWEGPSRVAANVRDVRQLMATAPPIDAWGEDVSGIERVAHYVRSCTNPSDRVLVVSYAPWVYFLSGRGFAGGHVWLQGRYFSTAEDQALMVSRLEREQPPIVLTAPAPRYSEYLDSFPRLDAFLNERYTLVGTIDFGDNVKYRVLTRQGLSSARDYPALGLPCFAS